MKKILLLLILTISFSINAQWSYPGSNWAIEAQNSIATGYFSAAMGNATLASGSYSTSMGNQTTASDYASLVVGQYNSSGSSVTNSATVFNTENTAFVIGNGTDSSNKSDAFKVMFSGDTYVSGSLYLRGSAITSTSAELNILDGVTATTAELNILDGVTANASEFNLLDGVTTIGPTGAIIVA